MRARSTAWLRRVVSPELLEWVVIGSVAALDRPLPPEALVLGLLQRHLISLTDDLRQAEFEEVLSATIPVGPVAVLGSETALRTVLDQRSGVFVLVAA